MSIKNFIIELFKDERGSISIKPFIAFLGAITLCSLSIIQCFTTKELNINQYIIDSVAIITAIGMGSDSIDKFSYKKPDKENEIKND